MTHTYKTDIVIIGAGAAGLMCAAEAAKRGRRVVIIDHANKPGKKILMSGGGRCNFTNYYINFDSYISHNPHFCKSALSRYTQWHFIELVKKHQIPFHEKAHGQLFCNNKSKDIVEMLLHECEQVGVNIWLNTSVESVDAIGTNHYLCQIKNQVIHCESLIIASGGLSIPTMGASPLGYQLAEKFGLSVFPTRAGLVPFTLQPNDKQVLSTLSGVSVNTVISNQRAQFSESMLFTHRGLSGPAILQISSYWHPGEAIQVNLIPGEDLINLLQTMQIKKSQCQLKTILADHLPKRVVTTLFDKRLTDRAIHSFTECELHQVVKKIQSWQIKPNGTEGYRTAEVTLGGVDCDQLSSKTMEVKDKPGLYFIGEVLDVTGWLGGYNFQWAWSSAWAAGQVA